MSSLFSYSMGGGIFIKQEFKKIELPQSIWHMEKKSLSYIQWSVIKILNWIGVLLYIGTILFLN